MKFKVGDIVKVIAEKGKLDNESWENSNFDCIGKIIAVNVEPFMFPYTISFDNPNDSDEYAYNENELELITSSINNSIVEYKLVSNKYPHFFVSEVNNVLEEGYEFLSDLKIITDSSGTLIYIREFVKYNKGE